MPYLPILTSSLPSLSNLVLKIRRMSDELYLAERGEEERDIRNSWRQRTYREGQVWWGNKSLMVGEAEYEITLRYP